MRGLVLACQAYTRARLVYLLSSYIAIVLLSSNLHGAKPTLAAIGLAIAALVRAVHGRSLDVERLCASLLVRVGGLCRR